MAPEAMNVTKNDIRHPFTIRTLNIFKTITELAK
jgi:hypothetical protein